MDLGELRDQGRKRHCHSRSCLVSPTPTSLQSQSPDEGSGPSLHVILPHPPSPGPVTSPVSIRGLSWPSGGSSPSQPPLQAKPACQMQVPARGVWHIWLGQPWRKSLALTWERLFVGSSLPHGYRAWWSGVGGAGNEGGLITLEVLQLLSSCLLLKELPQPCATRLLVPNTSSPG